MDAQMLQYSYLVQLCELTTLLWVKRQGSSCLHYQWSSSPHIIYITGFNNLIHHHNPALNTKNQTGCKLVIYRFFFLMMS